MLKIIKKNKHCRVYIKFKIASLRYSVHRIESAF